ncbi:MAG: hypothetical protein R2784_21430 [Saprospiraceae bacterium]
MLEAKEYQHIDTFYKDNIEYKKIYCDNTIREIKEVTTLLNNTYPNIGHQDTTRYYRTQIQD